MVRMLHMRSSTKYTLIGVNVCDFKDDVYAHQLKPSRGSRGSATIEAIAAARGAERTAVLHRAVEKARIVDVHCGKERGAFLLYLAAFTPDSQPQ